MIVRLAAAATMNVAAARETMVMIASRVAALEAAKKIEVGGVTLHPDLPPHPRKRGRTRRESMSNLPA